VTQIDVLRHTLAVLECEKILYAIVGSYASGVWGDPRMTLDVDVVVQIDAQHVDPLLASFPAGEYYVSRAAVEEVVRLQSQFNVIHPTSGQKVDFMVTGPNHWAQPQLARRIRITLLPDCEGYVAPDDVILGKLVYFQEGGSEKHLRDIRGILQRSGQLVDREYLGQAAERHGVADVWRRFTDP
jgi:hypothetical protein